MADLPDLTARLRLDTSQLDGAVSKAAGIGGAVGGAIGGLASGGIQAGIAAITDFATGSVDAFARLEDATAAAGVLFGSESGKIAAAAEGAAARVGLSQQQYIDAAGTIGTFGKAAGLQGAPLTDFTNNLANLSGDLASFKGTSTEQAVEAVGAALRGESEPIRAYGVLLDVATVQQEAQRIGLVKTVVDHTKVTSAKAALGLAQQKLNAVMHDAKATDAERAAAQAAVARGQDAVAKATAGTAGPLTQQQKLLATQSAIMRQTTDAQGDFARTSDSTANTQKRLAAESANVQAQLGAKLAPALTAIRQILLLLITNISGVIGFFQRWAPLIGIVGGTILALAVATNAAAIGTAIVSGATRAYAAAQAVLNAVLDANPIALVVIALAAIAAGLIYAYKHSETFRNVVDGALSAVGEGFRRLYNGAVAPVVRFILHGFATIVRGFASVLGALGHVPGFGWAKAAADKMNGAARKADDLANSIRDIPSHKNVSVVTSLIHKYVDIYQRIVAAQGAKNIATIRDYQPRARGGPVTAGEPYRVGERGEELFIPDVSGTIVPNDVLNSLRSGPALSGSGGPGEPVELGPRTLAALAEAQRRTLVQVLLDGAPIAAKVNTMLGREAASLSRGGY